MRTRFLSVDHSTSVTFQDFENLEFLRLPPPHVPPLSASTFGGICCFDDVSALNISLEMETLPIDSSLSKFLSDVVPAAIEDEAGEFSSFSPRSNAEVQYQKDKNELFHNAKEENCFEAVDFEMPELDLSLENTCFFEGEEIELFAVIPEASENLLQDMLNPEPMLRRPIEILKSIYSVDDITMEQKDFLFEEAVCAQDQVLLHNSRFPVFEVDEIVLGNSGGPHMEQGFLLLKNIEPQVCPQKERIAYSQELLDSLKFDILDYVADHSLSKQCFEDMPPCLTLPLEMDVLSIIELPLLEGNSVFRQGIPDDNSFWSASQVNFEEIQFLEFDSCQSIEGRSSKPAVKSFDRNPVVAEVSCINQIASHAAMEVQQQQRDLKLHPVKLAGNVRELVNDFLEEKCDMGSSRAGNDSKAFCMPLPVPRLTSAVEPERIPIDMSFPDSIIIVNTHNFDKEMIISRRSTYQKILALEKKGVQIVERDLKLPVDIILSAAMCLVVYDCRNIGKKASAPDEASSCLPLCIENIAADVLTSLSFAFSSCILVFEGEIGFLADVMESSDELYAAAAGLRIDVQVLCSYSSELTDEIILSCIGRAPKLTRHTYPKMPESETLGEYFLTMFPSINPLSAHAILSSVCTLVEFFEWSHEHRILAMQNFHVPDESLSLLSTLCKYGELEDSRSAITDCSSFVSSASYSENCHEKTDSFRKKENYIECPPKTFTPVDNLSDLELLKQGRRNLPKVSKPLDTWMSGNEEIFNIDEICNEIEKHCAFVTDKAFRGKQVSGPAKGSDISNDIKNLGWPLDDNLFGETDGFDMPPMNKRDFHLANNSKNRREDLIGKVIDIHDSFSLGEDFSDIANSLDLSFWVAETDKDHAVGNFRTASRLHPTFPTAAEISSDSSNLVNNYAQSLRAEYNRRTDADFSKHKLDLKHQEKLLEDSSIQRTATNFPMLSVEENNTLQRGGTQLSKAAQSAQPQHGSPGTIKFLKEKNISRQQSVPRGMSPICFPNSGNISKGTTRKSTSILDFYRYQGGSSTSKRQKRPTRPSSSSKKKKTSSSFSPTWTPLDKKARQTLSFSRGGGGGQTKLVWNDKDAQIMDRRFYH